MVAFTTGAARRAIMQPRRQKPTPWSLGARSRPRSRYAARAV